MTLTPGIDLDAPKPRQGRTTPTGAKAAQRLGLRLVSKDELSIRRRRAGQGWSYLDEDGCPIRHEPTIRRLRRLAVPPAYEDVLFASDPAAHLQAVGRDAAGRLQYRYHPKWETVREIRKARRLERLAGVLPRIRRSIAQYLGDDACGLAFTCSAVIELIARSAIRPGNEAYARLRGTRGAATLLKSNVRINGTRITLTFRAKGGKTISKEFECARLAAALTKLAALPGRRIFQYRGENGAVHAISTTQVNSFLRQIAGTKISLKDFRTLLASASVLESLCAIKPASSERQRRKQVMQAIREAAAELANTPTICRKSYVHTAIVEAFEDGVLERFADAFKTSRSEQSRAELLAKVLSKV